jgi:phosphoenolpyruvate-protein kinase (PTS system EI component)
MPPNSLLEVKRCLIDSRRVRLRKLAQEMLKASTAKEKQNLLARINGN